MLLSIILSLVVTYLATNYVMVDGSCQVMEGHDGFTYENITGDWYIGGGSRLLMTAFKNMKVTASPGPGDNEVTFNGTALQFQNFGLQHLKVTFKAHWIFPRSHFSIFKASLDGPFSIFTGSYNVASFDPKCHIIIQGCLKFSLNSMIVLFYRQKDPTPECKEETKAAFEKAGLDYNAITRDSLFSLWK